MGIGFSTGSSGHKFHLPIPFQSLKNIRYKERIRVHVKKVLGNINIIFILQKNDEKDINFICKIVIKDGYDQERKRVI